MIPSWTRPTAGPSTPSRYRFDSEPLANPRAIVQGSQGDSHWRFTVLSDAVIRFEWSPDRAFEDRASTFALFRNFDVPKFQVTTDTNVSIRTTSLEVVYDKTEFSQESLQIHSLDKKWQWKYTGESYGDLGGTTRTLDGADGRAPLAPGIASRHQPYAVLDDTKSMLFDAGGWIGTRKPGRKDGYFFLCGTEYAKAIKDFYAISGSPPLLPRWALGNWWSRYHEYSDTEYLGLMEKFRGHGVPISVGVIDMDWHLVNIPRKFGSGWTGYTWNKDLFPDPKAFLAALRKMGIKVALNDHPADGIRSYEDSYEDMAKALSFDTSSGQPPIKFDCCSRLFMDAYFDVLKAKLEDQGVDFWWMDWQQGEESKLPGVDPLWVLNHYHFLTSMRNAESNQQPMTFSRYAGPGSHRYPVGFSGDTVISWATLKFQPEFTATASNIGYGWWSHDIGGHFAGIHSNELTARWVQLGCFSPIMRLHSTKNQWNSKEPWNFEPETDRIMTAFLQLRHRLLPFLYTMSARATYDGEPLVQPLYWKHADQPTHCYSYPNQFYFGPNLLVAPITQPTSPCTFLAAVPVWLPSSAARYIDILSPSLVYTSDRSLTLHRPLHTLPVLAPEGTILVTDAVTPSALAARPGVTRPAEIEIVLVVGASGRFDLIEEPFPHGNTGPSPIPSYNDLSRIPIIYDQPTGALIIGPAYNQRPEDRKRRWRLRLIGKTSAIDNSKNATPFTRSALFDYGTLPAPVTLPPPVYQPVPLDPCFVPGNPNGVIADNSTFADLGTLPSEYMAEPGRRFWMYLGRDLELDVVDIKTQIKEVIRRAETSYQKKDEIWEVVMGDEETPVEERVKGLWAMEGVDKALKAAIMEVWASDDRAEGNAVGCEVWEEEGGEDSEEEEGFWGWSELYD
ncbi:glycoside hydrolase [Podospora conica]|nr:glycoside hydrolase [Schizothecium conicum]